MSPLLFQTLIKTLCLFLLWAALANSSIFDNLDNLQTMLQQLETQVQPQPESTTPPIEYFSTSPYFNDTLLMPMPEPPLLGQTMASGQFAASDEMTIVTTSARNPQPFTILMNFQNDGTMSLQIFNQDQTSWTDQGRCRHGQMYDPVSNVCRDVFCAQGYVLRPQGCVEDDNYNSTYDQPIKPPPNEMRVEMTLRHSLCIFIMGFNDTSEECNKHRRVLKPTTSLLESFRRSFVRLLEVNDERITNMTLTSYLVVNESSLVYRDPRSATDEWVTYNDIHPGDEARMNFWLKYEMKELLIFQFDIKDMNDFPGETRETIVLFYQLTLYTLDKRFFNVGPGHKAYITDVDEVKPQLDEKGWCEDEGDVKEYSRSDFLVLASFEDIRPVYFVYLPETNMVYRTGYYYFTVVYQRTPSSITPSTAASTTIPVSSTANIIELEEQTTEEQIILTKGRMLTTGSSTLLLSLIDVTDIVIEQNATNTIYSKILFVCNRNPRITTPCINHETIRLSLCELDYMIDGSYCMRKTGHCFFVDEFERDPIEPDRYIRVCKYYKEKDNSTTSSLSASNGEPEYDLNVVISGWASFIFTIISLVSMFFCLITFALFRELRNIPGWNIINLTIALTLAQLSFLLGSFASGTNTFCFVIAMTTHYGFLASFFWMNVIAFDLHRNFRKKASHVILQSIRVKDRLPLYAVYGWAAPFLIVLAALTVDLVNKEAFNLTPFRPCYGGYLEGCNRISSNGTSTNPLPFRSNSTRNLENQPENAFFKNTSQIIREHPMDINDSFVDLCQEWASQYEPHYVIVMGGSCWIRNGSANLLFFGLPVAVILVINAIYYFLTVFNIRRKKRAQKQMSLRRFSRVKLPGDEDVKFFIQMAVIMGFTWIVGFFLTSISWSSDHYVYIIYYILTYLFILLNASNGVFILFAFLFKKEVKSLYKKLFTQLFCQRLDKCRVNPKVDPIIMAANAKKVATESTKSRIRENSQSSTSQLCPPAANDGSISSTVTTPRLDSLDEESEKNENGNDVFLKI